MLRIVEAQPLGNYTLKLRFNDGASGVADLSHIKRNGVFEPWNEPGFFERVFVHPEFGTVTWPGELDLDPYVLYSQVTGRAIEEVLETV